MYGNKLPSNAEQQIIEKLTNIEHALQGICGELSSINRHGLSIKLDNTPHSEQEQEQQTVNKF